MRYRSLVRNRNVEIALWKTTKNAIAADSTTARRPIRVAIRSRVNLSKKPSARRPELAAGIARY